MSIRNYFPIFTIFLICLSVPVAYSQTTGSPNSNHSYIFINSSDCVYFYAKSIKISMGEYSFELPPLVEVQNGTCAENGTSVAVTWSQPTENVESVSLELSFKETVDGYWQMTGALISIGCEDDKNCTSLSDEEISDSSISMIYGPMKFSYHCSNDNIWLTNTSVSVIIEKIQVQAMRIEKDQFGPPNDCVGFFTIGVLSTVLVSLLLASILAFGVCMIMSISTVDRFEDPKAKGLQVYQTNTD